MSFNYSFASFTPTPLSYLCKQFSHFLKFLSRGNMLALLCSFFHHEYSPLHSTPPFILALSSPPLFPFFLHSLYIDAYNHLDSLFFSFLLLDCLLSVYINENIKSSARFTHPLLPFVSYFITRYHRHKILIVVALRSFSRAYTHPFKASRFKFLL